MDLLLNIGGCSQPCDIRLPCGHVCPRLCHPDNEEHVGVTCHRPCAITRPFAPHCDHACSKRCHFGNI